MRPETALRVFENIRGVPLAKKYRDTDYLCLSAQIRSRENALLRRSQLDRMLESGDAKQAARILAEQGWESFDPTQPGALDAAILTQREALYRELSGQLPDDAVLAVFRLKYDCHNIKTLIKARGADVSALLLDARDDPGAGAGAASARVGGLGVPARPDGACRA